MTEVRRILVALDSAFAQSRVPELATRIATEISAEIDAMLLQDAALMTAADLPFAQEILTLTGARRGLSRDTLDLDFQVLARMLEQKFEQLAGPAGLRWNLRAVSGAPIPEIIAAAGTSDLLILGLPRDIALDLEAMRRIARQTGRPAVFLGDLASPKAGIAVLDGETELKRDLPSIAGFLARAFPGELTDYRRASPPQIGELRRRTILVLPDPPAGD